MKNISFSIRFREFALAFIGKCLKSPKCPVIFCLHSVDEDGWIFNISQNKLELFTKEILKIGKIVGLKNILEKKKYSKLNFVLTFDDGYESVFTKVYPLFKKFNITAGVFITGVPDKNGNFGYLNGRKLLNLDQIKTLKKSGWDIGYHTKSHHDLRYLDEKELADEILNVKNKLEKKLGFIFEYFAYPYGVFKGKALKIVKKSGYEYAFTGDGGKFDVNASDYKIGRVLLDKYIKPEDLKVLTSSCGLTFNKLLTWLLRIKDNLI